MTLRLRLTLVYTCLVAGLLLLAGLGLHVLLGQSLNRGVSENLKESTELLSPLLNARDGNAVFVESDPSLARFSSDDVAVVFASDGAQLGSLGRVPAAFTLPPAGLSDWQDWRVLRSPLDAGSLVVMQALEDVGKTLARFDTVFWSFAPLMVVFAFIAGYALAGAALAPVDRLTRAAYDLAQRRAWRELLPEPRHRDELWRLSVATNTLLGELAQLIETERRLTDDAAHELRTPLTVVQGRLEQALEKSREAGVRTVLGKALGANQDLLALVEKLLLLARTEAGQGLTRERLDLRDVLRDSAELLQPLFQAKNLSLRLALPDSPVPVSGDKTALGLLVKNLLDNALKFTPSGEVRLELTRAADYAVVSVTDTGPGIPAAALPHLFERFYQAEVGHRRAGSGLGLAIADSVARHHGGTLGAQTLQGGAVFTLRLPLCEL